MIRLELGMDEIESDIQKSGVLSCGRQKGGYLRKRYTKKWKKNDRGIPRTRWIDQIWKDVDMRGGNGNKYIKK